MAPEQITGSSRVDGRADQYSLACVLYEMLTGRTPASDGPDRAAEVIRAEHHGGPGYGRGSHPAGSFARMLTTGSPRSRVLRRALGRPSGVATVIKLPPAVARIVERPKWLLWGAGAFLAAAIIAVVAFRSRINHIFQAPEVALDTMSYVVLPAVTTDDTTATYLVQLLHDVISRWSGITVQDQFQVNEAIERHGGAQLDLADAAEIARKMRAGRYFRLQVTPAGSETRIGLDLYDAATNARLGSEVRRVPDDFGAIDTTLQNMTDVLLVRNGDPNEPPAGTTSLPARQAWARGHRALDTWNLDAADSAFAEAAWRDPNYAQAHLWLALVRAWNGKDPATWSYAAEQAAARQQALRGRDSLMARAIVAQGRGEFGVACARWDSVARRAPEQFAGWYGAAQCRAADKLVIPDPQSPSRYRFRSSYGAALESFQKAFQLFPPVLSSSRSDSYAPIRHVLRLGRNQLYIGHGATRDSAAFYARPSWQDDSIVFVPWPLEMIRRSEEDVAGRDLAQRHLQDQFADIARTWVSSAPNDPYAREALAIALELRNDRGALDTIASARRLAAGRPMDPQVAITHARLLLKFGLPDDTALVRHGTALVDSLLGADDTSAVAGAATLAGLAALTGRGNASADLYRRAAVGGDWDVLRPLRRPGPALLVFAGLGAPKDSIVRLEREVRGVISLAQPVDERSELLREWLARPLAAAFPHYQAEGLSTLPDLHDPLIEAEQAWLRADTAATLRILFQLRHMRADSRIPVERVSTDYLYPETWLLAQAGDTATAVEYLNTMLRAIALGSLDALSDPLKAATLVQAMAFRAELALAGNDLPTAVRWAGAVVRLWNDADLALQPTTERMRRITEGVIEPGERTSR